MNNFQIGTIARMGDNPSMQQLFKAITVGYHPTTENHSEAYRFIPQ